MTESTTPRYLIGDVREVLRTLPERSINTCVTSPPYWALRDYKCDGQLGLESMPEEYVVALVDVFREVWRVLKDDGTVWLNLGDSYSAGNMTPHNGERKTRDQSAMAGISRKPSGTLKPKNLCMIPSRVAMALQQYGWYLRSEIIWSKPNPMPESVRDRPTKSHEKIFLLSKSSRYYYDYEAIAEPVTDSTIERVLQPNIEAQIGSYRVPGKTNGNMKAVIKRSGNKSRKPASARGVPGTDGEVNGAVAGSIPREGTTRNKRDVWTVSTKPYKGAHFAVFPEALIEPCILAGCPIGGTVLDPFAGSGTTLAVSRRLGRKSIGIDLNPEYRELAVKRCGLDIPDITRY